MAQNGHSKQSAQDGDGTVTKAELAASLGVVLCMDLPTIKPQATRSLPLAQPAEKFNVRFGGEVGFESGWLLELHEVFRRDGSCPFIGSGRWKSRLL